MRPSRASKSWYRKACRHLVIGGDVDGGRMFNQFPPSLVEGNAQDAGQGRLIPAHPWESYQLPLAALATRPESSRRDEVR